MLPGLGFISESIWKREISVLVTNNKSVVAAFDTDFHNVKAFEQFLKVSICDVTGDIANVDLYGLLSVPIPFSSSAHLVPIASATNWNH